jgi:uncharacterized membrane protein YdbT with pleckstrin-like domain
MGALMTFQQTSSEREEKLIGRAKQHLAIFIFPLIPLLFSLIIFIIGLQASSPGFYFIFSFGFFIAGILDLIRRAVEYFTTIFELTDRRLIVRTGLLRRRELELLLSQVESIDVDKPLLGRLLDYGTVRIVGTGGTSQNVKSLKYPTKIRRAVLHLLSEQS